MKMSKKGEEGLRLIIFSAGGLLIGVLVMVFLLNVAGKLLATSNEDIIAKDLGFAIMTISGAPSDIIYRYEPNTEKYSIFIRDDRVTVVSSSGEASGNFFPMKGVDITPSSVNAVLSIPLIFKDGKVSFSEDEIQITDYCKSIPGFFNDEVKVKILDDLTSETRNIKTAMQLMRKDVDRISFVEDYTADIILHLRFGTEEKIVTNYHYDSSSQNHNMERVACFLRESLESIDYIQGTELSAITEDKSIYVFIGTRGAYQNALTENSDFPVSVATGIYSALIRGISG